jgi:Ca2+-binding RTX toxin-like protein
MAVISGSSSDDTLAGGDGNDTLLGGSGSDLLAGNPVLPLALLSFGIDGATADGNSFLPSLSTDGHLIAFSSMAANLVPNDGNTVADIFVRDRITGITSAVSVASDGTTSGNGVSYTSAMTPDGQYVAFWSRASNLIAGDSNGVGDIFVRNLVSGVTSRVSTAGDGHQANGSSQYSPVITPDGRFVVFTSDATNLLDGDTNAVTDIFIKDLATGLVRQISTGAAGQQANAASYSPAVSADGQLVAFYSHASNLVSGDNNGAADVFFKNLASGAITRISVAPGGGEGNGSSFLPSISADGRRIVFVSDASNLVAGDTNGLPDIFVKDLVTGDLSCVSTDAGKGTANGASYTPMISGNGRYVVFASDASDLVAGDTNGLRDLFIRDLENGITIRVSTSNAGGQANGPSFTPTLTADGRFLAFSSGARNLAPGDANSFSDVFLRDMGYVGVDVLAGGSGDDTYDLVRPDTVQENAGEGSDTVIARYSGYLLPDHVENLMLAAGDRAIGYGNALPNRMSGSAADEVLVGREGDDTLAGGEGHDILLGGDGADVLQGNVLQATTLFANVIGAPVVGLIPAFSVDGRYAVFASNADGLVANDTNAATDIFIKSLVTGQIVRLSTDASGAQANAASYTPGISTDGHLVAFASDASNLVADDTNAVRDIFVKDGTSGTVTRISTAYEGGEANGDSVAPALSPDGRYVAFVSVASNLVDGDNNGVEDVFVKDLLTESIRRVSTGALGEQADAGSFTPAFSADGRYLIFASFAKNLVAEDANGRRDIFIKDLLTDAVQRVSTSAAGNQLDGNSYTPIFLPDGVHVAFASDATNAIAGDDNGVRDVFLKNLATGDVARLSLDDSGAEAAAASYAPVVTPDGRFIVFTSDARLAAADIDDKRDVFATDLWFASVDVLSAGPGDDRYVLFRQDAVVELAGEGNDTVEARFSGCVLPENVENLVLNAGNGAFGYGNALGNQLSFMNAAATLSGGLGDDTYHLWHAQQDVVEQIDEGRDTILASGFDYSLEALANVENLALEGGGDHHATGNAGNNEISGDEGENTLTGLAGDDTLNGGPGIDRLIGGDGDDVYLLGDGGDIIVEDSNGNSGADTVVASFTGYVLADNVESLVLAGDATIDGNGNDLANVITGNGGSNVIAGGGGIDTLIGGAGNDTYIVDATDELIVESVTGGDDLVLSAVTFSLAANVERLTLTGSTDIDGHGNSSANVITGNAGMNTLEGGAGDDVFVISPGIDLVVDFAPGDVIRIPGAVFQGVATLGDGTTVGINEVQFQADGGVTSIFIGTDTNPGADSVIRLAGAFTRLSVAGSDIARNFTPTISSGLTPQATTEDSPFIYALPANAFTDLDLAGGDSLGYTATCFDGKPLPSWLSFDGRIFSGTPANADVGSLSIRVTAEDSYHASVSTSFTLTIANSNDTPTGADSSVSVVEDTPYSFKAGDFPFSDVDAGSSLGGIKLLGLPGKGLLTYNGLPVSADTLIPAASLGKLRYTAAPDDFGAGYAEFSYQLDDGSGAANARSSADYTLTIDVVMDKDGANRLIGTDGDDRLEGYGGDDLLVGLTGADRLDGGSGSDRMEGGPGDDTYVVDSLADQVIKRADEGSDTIEAAIDYALGANVENLTLTGGARIGIGNAVNNKLRGNATNNTLDGRWGADTLIGGAGDDTYVVNESGDTIEEDRGQGDDTIETTLTSYTLAANLENLRYLGSGNFIGVGNDLANTFQGGLGNDRFDGGAGKDTCRVLGNRADYAMRIDFAPDGSILTAHLAGPEGKDEFASIEAIVFADQTLALESLYPHDETLVAGQAKLIGGSGNDLLIGGEGADWLDGGAGNDKLQSGLGSDLLDGGAGIDRLEGGAGDDTYLIDAPADLVVELPNGGTDTVHVGFTYTLGFNLENLVLIGANRINGVGNRDGNRIAGNEAANVLAGLGGADTLSGNGGDDILQGGDGNDHLDGGAGSDKLDGGLGGDIAVYTGIRADYAVSLAPGDIVRLKALDGSEDRLVSIEQVGFADGTFRTRGSDGKLLLAGDDALLANTPTYLNDVLTGTEENDRLEGLDGNDSLAGFLGADSLIGGNGNDTLDGGVGGDFLVGESGNDTYVVDSDFDGIVENANTAIINYGIDTVRTELVAWTLGANLERLHYAGTTGAGFTGIGNGLANEILGGTGDDSLDGGAGADRLIGGLGDDIYIIDSPGDRVVERAGEGRDTIRTTLAAFSLGAADAVTSVPFFAQIENLTYTGGARFSGTGNAGANRITGNTSNDRLSGLAGNDTLLGGEGNDTLLGGEGNDALDGGAGSNRYEGGSGLDTAYLAGVRSAYAVKLLVGNVLQLKNIDGSLETLLGVETIVFTNGTGMILDDESVAVNANAATETTPAGLLFNLPSYLNDTLSGSEADEQIDGLEGNDTISGAGGNDSLLGGLGNDSLTGGAGADTLTGGLGNDVFVFDATPAPGEVDLITDFALGDRIALDQDVFAELMVGVALDKNAFALGTAAADATDRLIYDRLSGNLYYDADGTGESDAVLIATLGSAAHPLLTAASFGVVG